jgi:hypothetical protein
MGSNSWLTTPNCRIFLGATIMKEEQLKKIIAETGATLGGLAYQSHKEHVQNELKKEIQDIPVIEVEADKQVTDSVFTKIDD